VQRIQIVSTRSDDFSEELIDEKVIFENRCNTAASCNIANSRCSFWCILCFAAQIICHVVCDGASHALAPSRKHFLKRDAVFFDVLVYSECGAFDSRVHAAIKASQEGNMAKKAKKAKKAKSAVKKTAKKTRKVAKKKK
jgi:hypothetical protein